MLLHFPHPVQIIVFAGCVKDEVIFTAVCKWSGSFHAV
ncbi:hypothetical protein AB434_3596 [Heyndrickxia coagulans]|uniref:Uncharacterized protein n=1 Tax=Heyndrickxia coagulans TaxID=1398 RepID=A0AAN0T633_HEYCO|nr:hypothetical protein SB48_HM08orf02662 [Heyndrickxia coagulans]AKN56001.1 hypothetical protein AB434_3596 [Heyndrickxia coagulans]KYC61819.1 hypothetical protein B4100_2958 [Heyndrickxia coagulans]KYC91828.1 hypothetical protein B4096_2783 [Heyndrickxia coagulans]